MSRYHSFNDFMTDVLDRADNICRDRHEVGLEDLYSVSNDTLRNVGKLIKAGWRVFIAVVVLFGAGAIGLVSATLVFLSTPIGWIVTAILGIAALVKIQQMYSERVLPNAVRDVGEVYKDKWESVEGNRPAIDQLMDEAAMQIVKKAEMAQSK